MLRPPLTWRINRVEIVGGVKELHFKSSPKSAEYQIGNPRGRVRGSALAFLAARLLTTLPRITSFQKMTLDVGCGIRKYPGSIGIDLNPAAAADVICDLEQLSLSVRRPLLRPAPRHPRDRAPRRHHPHHGRVSPPGQTRRPHPHRNTPTTPTTVPSAIPPINTT